MLDWLLAPLDPSRVHDVGFHLSWHARMMVVAWGFLVPIGVLSARYFKILPNQKWPEEVDNRTWWNIHRSCQYTAAALTVVAIVTIRLAPEITWSEGVHHLLGWTVVTFTVLQVGGGLLRGTKGGPGHPGPDRTLRGDHYDMTPRRIAFEVMHKMAGYAVLLVSVVAITSGMWQANAPRWMPLAMVLWWSCLALAAFWLQRRGMCVDTYQALWGPDPVHPGNRRDRLIGLGVRRRGEASGREH